jgi:hypothetical protein
MNHTNLSIGVIMAAALALMLVAGTSLSPLQQSYAHGKSAKAIFNPQFINVNKINNENKNGDHTGNSNPQEQQQQQQQQQQKPQHEQSAPEHNTALFKHDIRKNSEEKAQHMNQENFCIRGDVCKNSNVGLQTLGNDNSVTGFADQSKNAEEPTATPSPTPTPESNDASAATG